MNYKKTSFYKTKNVSSKKGQELAFTSGGSVSLHKDNASNNAISVDLNNCDFSVFLNKKTEKLVTALYMVTSFLSDNEPLKWKLRENAVALLSGITTARDNNVSEMENVFISHTFLIEEIISFLEIATTSKLISEMNFSILKKEYLALKYFIDSGEYMDEKSGKATLSDNFFNINEDEIKKKNESVSEDANALNRQNANSMQKEKIDKGQMVGKRQMLNNETTPLSGVLKQRNFTATENARVDASSRTLKDIKSERLNRRDAILKLFKTNRGKKLTIKDVSRHISTCSEKTIQRELTSLVLVGVLNKDGERRWSKYSLK